MKDSDLQLYSQFVRPELARVLEALKLDNVYHKALGDQLFYKKDGNEIAVSDFLGGFGSTILGHNHPEILKVADECQRALLPQHSQASLKAISAHLGQKINTLIKNKLQEERDFVVTFANTGTEAVEVALKHSLLEWTEKKDRFIYRLRTHIIQARVNDAVRKKIEDYCEEINGLSPIMLSLEKSFHGKTSGSVAVTANTAYRKMYQASPVEVKFFSTQELERLAETIIALDNTLSFDDGYSVTFSPIVGFIYEPIQGEGGIEEIPESFLKEVARKLKKRHIPLISDEIQSGLLRTGKFFCSQWFGIKPDYILLGKSLGGGIAKVSAAVIASNHYVDEFGWIHSSTFSEDDWSSSIALKALEIMELEESIISGNADKFEKRIRLEFAELQKKYPNVIKQVKGRGFFLGVEFNFDETSPVTDFMNAIYEHGHLTYVYTSYLLHRHNVRVGVTLSAPEIIRIEPSAFITESSIRKLIKGFDQLCSMISKRENLRLTSHLWNQEFTEEQLNTVSEERSIIADSINTKDHHIGFLTHLVSPYQVLIMDKGLGLVDTKEIDRFLKNYANQAIPFRYGQKILKGLNGNEIVLNLYGILQPSSFFENSLRNRDFKAARLVQEAVDLAHSHGMKYFGLGQFTSIVSENGLLLNSHGMCLTTGNSLTAGMAIEAIKKISKDKNIDLKKVRIGVVGFTGNICNVLTQIIADDVTHLVLIHRQASENTAKYKEAIDSLLTHTTIKKENLQFGHDLSDLKDCDVMIIGTNSSSEIIKSEHVKEGAIVLDISVPTNVQADVRKRKDVTYLQGGLVRLPLGQAVDHPWMPLKNGDCFACMAETITLGLHKKDSSYSMGRMNKTQVLDSLRLAGEVGVVLGGLRER